MRWLPLCALLLVSPARAQTPPAAPPAAPAPGAKLPSVEPLDIKVSVQPQKVQLGEPFVYELTLTHPEDQHYELDLPSDLGDFEMLSQSRTPPQAGANPAVTTFQLRLSAFKLDQVTLPTCPSSCTRPRAPSASSCRAAPSR